MQPITCRRSIRRSLARAILSTWHGDGYGGLKRSGQADRPGAVSSVVNPSLCQQERDMARSGLRGYAAGAVSAAFLGLSIGSPGFAQGAPDLNTMTTQRAAADICSRKLTSKALVRAALDRAKAKPELNAFVTLDETGAMKAATAFDSGRKKGACKPLGGVPIVIKDNIEVAG